MTNKILLIHFSGDRRMMEEHLVQSHPGSIVEAVSQDEKSIARFDRMFTTVRKDRYDAICFGCKDLSMQRYQFFLKSYLLVATSRRRLMIDENGTVQMFSALEFFFIDVPRFVVELVASSWVVSTMFVRLFMLQLLKPRTNRKGMR